MFNKVQFSRKINIEALMTQKIPANDVIAGTNRLPNCQPVKSGSRQRHMTGKFQDSEPRPYNHLHRRYIQGK